MQDDAVFPDLEEVVVHPVGPHLEVIAALLEVLRGAIHAVHHQDDLLGEGLAIVKKEACLVAPHARVKA